jgi:transglutaminase-like putative cysteine protease
MTRLRIEHLTQYQYQSDVTLAQHLAYLRTKSSPWQTVLHHELLVDPEATDLQIQTDAFDNDRYFLSLTPPHRMLRVQSTSEVRKTAR